MTTEPPSLSAAIEAILFTKGEPIDEQRLAKVLDQSEKETHAAIELLESLYKEETRGLMVLRKDGMIQLVTKPALAAPVEKLIKNDLHGALSKSALEVLSIIAYRGPISKARIEAIRGVNCSFTLRALLMRGLIEKFDDPGDERSKLYRISFRFLKKLGVESVEELPDFESLSGDEKVATVENAAEEK